MVLVGLISRIGWDVTPLDNEEPTLDTLVPPLPIALTKRKFVLGASREVKPVADDGTVKSKGCPDWFCPAGESNTLVTYNIFTLDNNKML